MPDEPTSPKSKIYRVVLAVVAVLTVAYFVVVFGFLSTGVRKQTYFTTGTTTASRIHINAVLTDVDPVKGTVLMRMSYRPMGTFAGPRGVLTTPIVLRDSDEARPEQTFKAGDTMLSNDIRLSSSGDTDRYPFDRHVALLQLDVGAPDGAPVPASITVTAGLQDWSAEFGQVPGEPQGEAYVNISFHRSDSVITLALGIMTVEVLMVLVQIVVVTRAIATKKVQFATLAALAAMLFAVPAVRNSMPGTPPVGTLSDFLVFFWALMTIGGCLMAASLAWFFQTAREGRDPS